MNKKTLKNDNTVITSDKYLSESGVQGGKAIAEHIVLGSFIFGIPFFILGLTALICIILGYIYPINTAIIIGALLVTVIGLLLVIGGYNIYRTKK
jgi:hypothetical protein